MRLFLLLIALVAGLDQVSKAWIVAHFSLFESKVVIPGLFNLTHLTNNGAAFSILAGQPAVWRQVFFIAASLVALVCIWIAQRSFGRQGLAYTTSLGLIAGGAVGNLIDRIRFGHVIDFLDFYVKNSHWPAFNVADSAITVGVGLFMVKNLFFDRNPPSLPANYPAHPDKRDKVQ